MNAEKDVEAEVRTEWEKKADATSVVTEDINREIVLRDHLVAQDPDPGHDQDHLLIQEAEALLDLIEEDTRNHTEETKEEALVDPIVWVAKVQEVEVRGREVLQDPEIRKEIENQNQYLKQNPSIKDLYHHQSKLYHQIRRIYHLLILMDQLLLKKSSLILRRNNETQLIQAILFFKAFNIVT